MNLDQIEAFLKDFENKDSSNAKLEEVRFCLRDIKAKYVSSKDEERAKALWCLEQVLAIQNQYIEAYESMKQGEYYKAWGRLERCELKMGFLESHLPIDDEYSLSFISKHVKQYQSLYPYKMFYSPEILEHKKECTICRQVVSIRNPCGHEVGEVYGGEMCCRKITECEFIGVSFVESPVQKYSVLFAQDEKTGEVLDHYNYSLLNYLFRLLQCPFDPWDIKWTKIRHPHSKFPNLSRNDECPCGSGEKYKKCCLNESGVLRPHCDFIFSNPSPNADLSTEYSY